MSPLHTDIQPISAAMGTECDALLQSTDCGLVYGSLAYLQFLEHAMPGARLHYLALRQQDRLLAYLPLALRQGGDGRKVVNALPFYGGHGGPWIAPGVERESAQRALLGAALDWTDELGAAAITLVENPLMPIETGVLDELGLQVVDERIGQISWLAQAGARDESALFAAMHVKTRNATRKGLAQNMRVQLRTDEEALTWLQAIHETSIRALGGTPKSMAVMHALVGAFPLGKGSLLYTGSISGQIAAALLLLVHHDTVEYFTPAVAPEHRDRQLLSALILHSMREQMARGARLWNWGGTWLGQTGVYRFKHRWGARDLRYRYLNRIFDDSLRREPAPALAVNHPFFYVRNYST
jgi:Acetyltransferase (GNAT) domain